MKNKVKNEKAKIGVLCWENTSNSLSPFEKIPGHIQHPETFNFPVKYERIKGANFNTVVKNPSKEVLENMVKVSKRFEKEGIKAVTTSCGFNSIFQKELASKVNIPVFTSSLLQIPLVAKMIKDESYIGVLTADKNSLTKKHMETVDIDDSISIDIAGVQNTETFSSLRDGVEIEFSEEKFCNELLSVTKNLINNNNQIEAIVLECTDLSPFSEDIKKISNLPVYDIVSLTKWVYNGLN